MELTKKSLAIMLIGVPIRYNWILLEGVRSLEVFTMRSMASGAAFHCAFLHATQQVFLEAHELAFRLLLWRMTT